MAKDDAEDNREDERGLLMVESECRCGGQCVETGECVLTGQAAKTNKVVLGIFVVGMLGIL